ncbi:hypothetical protein SALB1_3110 [Salinisphaera sp. LB1]|nr:hypothetical protein SALB1_3110 [Salinisphaera sp. LB1]
MRGDVSADHGFRVIFLAGQGGRTRHSREYGASAQRRMAWQGAEIERRRSVTRRGVRLRRDGPTYARTALDCRIGGVRPDGPAPIMGRIQAIVSKHFIWGRGGARAWTGLYRAATQTPPAGAARPATNGRSRAHYDKIPAPTGLAHTGSGS